MPAQSNRSIWHPFSSALGACPPKSGVRKVFIRGRGVDRYRYYYFSFPDRQWYNASGANVTREVISWGEVSK